jgi:broad specificity phosphatase PhoE
MPATQRPDVKLYLVRHGEVENPDRLVYGRLPGFPLSARGRDQIEATSAFLAARGSSIERAVSSPLARALETAMLIASALGLPAPSTDERLVEADSPYDGLPRGFAPRAYVARWLSAPRKRHEPALEIAARMSAVLSDACGSSRDVVLVSHQRPIQVVRKALEHTRWSPRCACGSVTTLHLARRDRLSIDSVEYWEP